MLCKIQQEATIKWPQQQLPSNPASLMFSCELEEHSPFSSTMNTGGSVQNYTETGQKGEGGK